MNKRRRHRSSARRPPFKAPKPVVLILCEGDATEPDYLNGFAAACRNARVHVNLIGDQGAPANMVSAAVKMKRDAWRRSKREADENLRYDSVWCVFDIDQHAHVANAKQLANAQGIELAVSNPCFELWLVLHFRDQPGMQSPRTLQSMLQRIVRDYDKHVKYSIFAPGYLQAVTRARQVDAAAAAVDEASRNPTTGVWRLTESIRND